MEGNQIAGTYSGFNVKNMGKRANAKLVLDNSNIYKIKITANIKGCHERILDWFFKKQNQLLQSILYYVLKTYPRKQVYMLYIYRC